MRVWLIQTGEMLPLTPSDRRMRTGHLAYELASRGHEVTWWSSAFDHMSKRWIEKKDKIIKLEKNLEIKLIKSIGYQKNVSLKRYIDHWYLAFKFKNQICKEKVPDIIICCLPDYHLAYEATRYALKHNIPIIVDLRDLWPDLFVDMVKKDYLKTLIRIGLYRDFWKARFALQHANSLITMSNHNLKVGREKGNRAAKKDDKLFYLGAERAIVKEKEKIGQHVTSIISSVKQKFVVLYIGTFNNICYPISLVNVAKSLSFINAPQKIEFILAGDGEHFEKLKQLASGYPQIKFTGWVNNDEIAALLKIANIGVVTVNTPCNTIANKICTYLSGGLPIISSLDGEVIELIESEGIGYSYQYDNLEELLEKILLLERSKELRHKMSLKAKHLFDRMFDSSKIYAAYADHIEKVKATSF